MQRWFWLGVIAMSAVAAAFDPPIARVGDLTMRIDAPQIVTQLETPIPVHIVLSNDGTQTLKGKARLQVIDRWRVVSANPQSFDLPPKSEKSLEFSVIAGEGTHNAHYPIHAFAEWSGGRSLRDEKTAHAVLVVEVRAPREPKPSKMLVIRLPKRGSIALWQQGSHQVSFQVFGQSVKEMPVGWWGIDETTGAHAALQEVDRGGRKSAIAIHPPWRKGAGTIFVDWQVDLPKAQPILLDFAFAIRDHDPQKEPPSDGVTVRVWVKGQDKEIRKQGDKAIRRKVSAVITNPSQHRQIGRAMLPQKAKQLFVGCPVNSTNFLSDEKVKGIVLTDPPSQSGLKNFFSAPIQIASVNNHHCKKSLKDAEHTIRGSNRWTPFSDRFNQSAKDLISKTVGDMGNKFAFSYVKQQLKSGLANFSWFVQQDCRQENGGIYDCLFCLGFLSHPLANSLCLRNDAQMPLPLMPICRPFTLTGNSLSPLLSRCVYSDLWGLYLSLLPYPLANSLYLSKLANMPLPLMPKWMFFHMVNSSRVISSLRNAFTWRSNSITSSSFPSRFCLSVASEHNFHFASNDPPKSPFRTGDGDDEWQLLYEHHSDSKVWVPARVDLSSFAGQRITLRLEVHPGPKNDTTCDLAFIGEPYLISGRTPPVEKPKPEVNQRLRLTALTRWQMAEIAERWNLLPKDKETKKQLSILRRVAPIARTDESFRQADDLAQRLLKRISPSRLKNLTRSLFIHTPSSHSLPVWVIAYGGELYAFALQPPEEGGWWDALGAIVFADRVVFFNGFDVRVLGENLSDWRIPSVLLSKSEKVEGNRLIAAHRLERNGVPYTLTMTVWSEGGTLKLRWQLTTTATQDKHQPLRITDCSLRSWSETAERVYIGHGNVIVRPQAFRLHADGHTLSTRHVGLDFEKGVSVVIGVDNPPDFFECQPSTHHYSIHSHMDTTFTLAASVQSVWQAAKRYRSVDPYKSVPTLDKLAGRFVFDLWGGWRYAQVAEQLEKAFRYGCTDALIIYHNWQRWGYDYRLPDIFPPNPQFGSLGDFRRMVEVCDRYGVLFAPHDNYIDFYPDAEGYSYQHICFTPDGNPVRAWFNEWRKAQSYRWRPDAFFPFMERNLKLIAQHIKPTAYFVDVFSSIGMFDWWTEDGEFHSILGTQLRWGEAFNFIRRILGGAPQISESGCDWLIGWLDGATTNHLRVDPNAPPGQWSVWRIRCDDAERIPWFDFAHHYKFALHGAGYSGRYQGGLPYEEAGIYSDDYICTEVLTGHPAMVSEPFGPQVVRKYWLLAELGRKLAKGQISSVEFADGDIHRQVVRWKLADRTEGAVWVNRSKSEWHIGNRTLPSFGFYAQAGNVQAAIEMLPTSDGSKVIAEWSLSDRFAYCNARTKVLFGWTPIQLVGAEVRWLGNRRFELTLRWRAERPTDEPYNIFVHFVNPRSQRGEQIAFQGDHAPDIPTTKWQGEIVTKTVVTVSEQWGADRYSVRIGLWNPKSGYRLRLMGNTDDTLRLVAGDLVLEGEGEQITNAKLELNPKLREMPGWLNRWNIQGKSVDFGFAVTDGAFRFDLKTLTLIPLPEHPPLTITLRLRKLLGATKLVAAIEAIDETGKAIHTVPFTQRNGEVTFETRVAVFAYRLKWGK
ncbi:MAG: hypothetical protein ACUVTP_04595 [Candidatus Fervidibacter sp.]